MEFGYVVAAIQRYVDPGLKPWASDLRHVVAPWASDFHHIGVPRKSLPPAAWLSRRQPLFPPSVQVLLNRVFMWVTDVAIPKPVRAGKRNLQIGRTDMKTFTALVACLFVGLAAMAGEHVLEFNGKDGPGKGKTIVLISGDEESRSE